MNLFVIDTTVRSVIAENQLIKPISMLGVENVFLIPKELVLEENYDKRINFITYKSTLNKYWKIFLLRNKVTSVYSRSSIEFFIIFKVIFIGVRNRVEFIFDFRGLSYGEVLYKGDQSKLTTFKTGFIKYFEKSAYHNADKIRTVSKEFKNFLKENFGKRSEIYIIPCCVSDVKKVEKSKRKYPLKFVYLGSVNKWQCFDEVCKVYKSISNIEETRLTVITRDALKAKSILLEHNINANFNVISLSHKEVIEKLSEFDFGFLLRQPNIINKVASPIKFLEYISNGVIPIISEDVGDFSSMVKNNKIGLVVEKDWKKFEYYELAQLLSDNSLSEKLFKNALNYTWQLYLDELKKTVIIK